MFAHFLIQLPGNVFFHEGVEGDAFLFSDFLHHQFPHLEIEMDMLHLGKWCSRICSFSVSSQVAGTLQTWNERGHIFAEEKGSDEGCQVKGMILAILSQN